MEAARRARPDDLDRLTELARAGRAELAGQRGAELWTVRHAALEPLDEWLASRLDRDDCVVLAGTIDDAVVGLGVVEVEVLPDSRRLGVVTELFVEPDARGVGVGECLAEEITRFCGAAGCVGIDAPALPGQREVKNFFERSGFAARLLVMHRPLSPGGGAAT